MVRQEACNSRGLIVGHREEVAESSTTEDDLFARPFGIIDSRSRVHLRRAHCSDEGTGDREVRVESLTIPRGPPWYTA